MSWVPSERLTILTNAPVRPTGAFVLYWMTSARRTQYNFGLQRAAEWSAELRRPILILEALRCDYSWAAERYHRFVIEGMADNAQRLCRAGIAYYPYVEPLPRAGSGLLLTLSRRACVIITDEFPAFFLPRMISAAASQVTVRMEGVDSNGLLPLRAAPRLFLTAHAFRRFLQDRLPEHLGHAPVENPLAQCHLGLAAIPSDVADRWPISAVGLRDCAAGIAASESGDGVTSTGGSAEASRRLKRFLEHGLASYAIERNDPSREATSGLSPYLHFGHIGAHEILARLVDREDWNPGRLSKASWGRRTGWWGMSEGAEAFLDQLVTWRELGFNMCAQRSDHDQYESLPPWARATLGKHAADVRESVYSHEQFEMARTHDPLWNAAQTQLRREGRIHNYLRMLWGKKILEWSESPREALRIMIELNNKYALDGRDPNSYSGIFWCLGRYDRPWGPERRVFGTVRYMSSRNTARKFDVSGYIARYAPGE